LQVFAREHSVFGLQRFCRRFRTFSLLVRISFVSKLKRNFVRNELSSTMMFTIRKGLLRFTEQGVSMYCPEKYTRHMAIPLSKIVQVEQTNRIVNIRVIGSSEWIFDYDSQEKAAFAYEELLDELSVSKQTSLEKQWQEAPAPDAWALEQLK